MLILNFHNYLLLQQISFYHIIIFLQPHSKLKNDTKCGYLILATSYGILIEFGLQYFFYFIDNQTFPSLIFIIPTGS